MPSSQKPNVLILCRPIISLVLDVMAGKAIESTSFLTSKAMEVDITQLNFFSLVLHSLVDQELVDAQDEVDNYLTSHYGTGIKATLLCKFKY